jgi:hypothetical protein
MRNIVFAALAATALGAAATAAEAAPAALEGFTASVPTAYTQWGPYYGRRSYYGRGYGYGGAAAAGVAGLAAGALIGGAIANSAQAAPPPPATVDPNLAAWCSRRYRSFDPATGTFMATTGERLVCTYP